MTDVSTPWSRGNVDFTAAGTDHRRRVAEAARKRLAVLDHATHYTSTTYAAEPRVVDHGHGGDHGHGAGSWQKTDVVDRPLGSRVEVSHRAVRNSPPRAPQGTAGVRVRAAAGAGSYASMYEERLGADASARSGVSWDRPETETARWAGEVETKLGEVSAFLKRTELGDAGVGWEDAHRPRASSHDAHGSRDRDLDATWSPRRPQTYARAEDVRDVDDGHGGAWRRAPLAKPVSTGFDDAAERSSGDGRQVNPFNATRRVSDRTRPPLNDRPGWNGELYVPEETRPDEADPLGGDDARRARLTRVTPKIGARDSSDAKLGETPDLGDENALAFRGTPSFAPGEDRHDDDSHPTSVTPFRVETLERSERVRAAARSTASKLAALKDRRASGRFGSRPSRDDAATSAFKSRDTKGRSDDRSRHERTLVVRFDEDAPIRGASPSNREIGAPSEFSEEAVSENARREGRTRKTSDALGETWGEFGTTLRPQPRTTRTGLIPASDRKKATHSVSTRAASTVSTRRDANPSRSTPKTAAKENENENAFGGYAPRGDGAERSAFGASRPSLSTSPAHVSDSIGHLSTELPPDMRGASVPEGADVGPSALAPCDTCGRKFNARALEIHSRSCATVFATKRRAFDVAKQRAAGTDLERFKRMGGGGTGGTFDDDAGGFGGGSGARRASKPRATGASARRGPASRNDARAVPKWKKDSERFRAGLRAGRTGQPIDAEHEEDLVPCPHCGRSFNERAAERHVPRCADIRAKPSRLARGGGRGAHVAATPVTGGSGGDLRKTRAF